MILTNDIFNLGKSSNNGWNGKQMKLLGIFKLYSGWRKDLIGKDFNENTIQEFISLKDFHFKQKIKEGRNVKKKVLNNMGINNYIPNIKSEIKKSKKERRKEKKLLNKTKSKNRRTNNKKLYKKFLNSAYWKLVRSIVIERDKNRCLCGNDKLLQVHHKTYKNHLDELNHLEDLITLCSDCHKKEHNILR